MDNHTKFVAIVQTIALSKLIQGKDVDAPACVSMAVSIPSKLFNNEDSDAMESWAYEFTDWYFGNRKREEAPGWLKESWKPN